jgi:hypothetical protein
MLIKIQAVALAAALMIPSHHLAGQFVSATGKQVASCKHCARPTPFDRMQGVAVTIMLRDSFATPLVDAVIRDEPGNTSTPLVAFKRTALSPALVYRALSSLSQSRISHHGPPSKRTTTVLSAGSEFQGVPDEDRAWVARLVAQLSTAPMTDVAGVGRFPAVTVTIDKQALRGK